MAIHFACPWCTQTISVDESKARERVECPHCNRPVKVPPKSTEDPPPVSQPPSVTEVKQEHTPQARAIPATAATAVSKTEPLAIWSLALSIVSLFSCGLILGLPGVICGHLALSNIRKNSRSEGRGMAVAGLTIGYVSMALWLIVITAMLGIRDPTAVANRIRVKADSQTIRTQLQLYESMNGFYPTTAQGLHALVTEPQSYPQPPRWSQLLKELPKDPWGSDYIYRSPGVKNPGGYDLFSAGPDRQPDTADDDWGGR
jgi:general secretion pathway protein G